MKSYLEKEDRNKVGFYLVQNEYTLETYVGSGVLGACEKRHIDAFNKGDHKNRNLKRAFSETPDMWNFLPIPIEDNNLSDTEIRDIAFDIEQEIIDEFIGKTPLFMNISKDARFCSVTHSVETLEKIRVAKKEWWATMTDDERIKFNDYKHYVEHSSESIALQKKSMQDFINNNPEYLEEKSSKMKELWESRTADERKIIGLKISTSLTGRPLSPEHAEHSRTVNIGRECSEEVKKKISLSNRKPKSEEGARNIRNAILLTAKPICFNGIEYSSINEAARLTGTNVGSIHYYLNSAKHSNSYYKVL